MKILRFNELNTAKTTDVEVQNKFILKSNEIAELLDETDIPDDLFYEKFKQRNKKTVVNFMKKGSPSQDYFEEIINILEAYGADVSDFKQ